MASSPHTRDSMDVSTIMIHIMLALIPTSLFGVLFFGAPALLLILVSMASAVGFEAAINGIRKKKLTIFDGSAALMGLLLALSLPPMIPLWMVIIGNFVSIVIAKQLFGGLGQNIFNPALTGHIFLSISYPVAMTSWIKPNVLMDHIYVSTATPLAKGSTIIASNWQLFWGNVGGATGETSAFAILLGALWLFRKGIIDWKTPASFLATLFVISLLAGKDPLFQWFSGGIMITTFFYITDYTTSPLTKLGRLLFGLSLGILVMAIRLFSNMPEGIAFCVVLMNGFVPLLDKLGTWLHLKIYHIIFKNYEEPS